MRQFEPLLADPKFVDAFTGQAKRQSDLETLVKLKQQYGDEASYAKRRLDEDAALYPLAAPAVEGWRKRRVKPGPDVLDLVGDRRGSDVTYLSFATNSKTLGWRDKLRKLTGQASTMKILLESPDTSPVDRKAIAVQLNAVETEIKILNEQLSNWERAIERANDETAEDVAGYLERFLASYDVLKSSYEIDLKSARDKWKQDVRPRLEQALQEIESASKVPGHAIDRLMAESQATFDVITEKALTSSPT